MNRLHRFFALFFICLQALLARGEVPCPFGVNYECVCSGDCNTTTVYQSAACKVAYAAPIDLTGPNAVYTITEELRFSGYVWELKENAFASFKSIGQLTLEQLPAGYVVNWHQDAFQGVKLSKLTAIGLNNAERKAAALRNLGKNGLEGLRVVNAYGENKLNLSAFEMKDFRKLTTLAFEHTPIGLIDDAAFEGLEYNLEELTLTGVELHNYPKNALSRLSNLRRLDLSDNSMAFPHGRTTFNNLTALEYLRLSGNDVRAARLAGAMEQLPPKLSTLELDRAQLTDVPFDILKAAPMLKRLSLADNFIHILQPSSVRARALNNMVSFIDANESATGTPETISSSQQPVDATTRIPEMPSTPNAPTLTSQLTYLNLDGNPITQVVQGAMTPFPLVTELSMKRTPLIAIDLASLDGMKQLKLLWLDDSHRLRLFASSGKVTPSTISHVSLVNSALDTIEPELANLVRQPTFELMDLSNNEFLLCGKYVNWTAKSVLCDPKRIKVDGAKCADMDDKLMLTYLNETNPDVCLPPTTAVVTPVTQPPPPPPPTI